MLGGKQGFTLPLTIVILAVVGFLSFSFYDMVRRERIESGRRFKKAQAVLELESAANYAFFRMEDSKEPWRTDSLQHTSKDGNISFNISHTQDGAFAKLTLHNANEQNKFEESSEFSVRTGFTPNSRPALVVTAPQISIALVDDARIEGGTALKNGSVNYSTNYKMRASKDAFYDTVFVGDTLPYFDTLQYFPELSREQFPKKFSKQSCIFDGTDIVPGDLSCSTVIMQGDSRCKKCKILADRIFIRERSQLQEADVIARTISLKAEATASGIFFAQDTLDIDLKNPQKEKVYYIVQGEKTGETDYVGKLSVQKLNAEKAAIIFLGDNWEETMKGIPVEVSENVDITGTIIANGVVDFRGKLKGQMTISSFSFYEGETLWRGFLRGGKIKGDTIQRFLLPDIIRFGGEPSYE